MPILLNPNTNYRNRQIPSDTTTVEIFSFGNYNPKLPPYGTT